MAFTRGRSRRVNPSKTMLLACSLPEAEAHLVKALK